MGVGWGVDLTLRGQLVTLGHTTDYCNLGVLTAYSALKPGMHLSSSHNTNIAQTEACGSKCQ